MKFFMFHLMPWPYLPEDFEQHHRSAWVTCPNTYYDADRGTAVYNNYLDELQQAEPLGFDGVCIKELGTGIILCLFQIGSMLHDLALKSMNLFATEVMPQVRAEVDQNLIKRLGAATTLSTSREARV